jgi:hypothetical protein
MAAARTLVAVWSIATPPLRELLASTFSSDIANQYHALAEGLGYSVSGSAGAPS